MSGGGTSGGGVEGGVVGGIAGGHRGGGRTGGNAGGGEGGGEGGGGGNLERCPKDASHAKATLIAHASCTSRVNCRNRFQHFVFDCKSSDERPQPNSTIQQPEFYFFVPSHRTS